MVELDNRVLLIYGDGATYSEPNTDEPMRACIVLQSSRHVISDALHIK
jgi:hypothetical protein